MPDRPPESQGPAAPESGAVDVPARSLSEILEELAQISHAQRGEASAMRGAVSELSRALARLFEMIRADRAVQHTRIAELEQALAEAQAQVRELEAAGAAGEHAPPAPTDFDALRGAAERLRRRTEQLVHEAGTPAEEAAREEARSALSVDAEEAIAAEERAEEDRIEAARLAVEASLAEEEAEAARRAADEAAASAHLPNRPIHDEPFDKPGILRIFPGAVLPPRNEPDFDVESELEFDEELPRQAVAQHAAPTLSPPPQGATGADASGNGAGRGTLTTAPHVPAGPTAAQGPPAQPADVAGSADADAPHTDSSEAAASPDEAAPSVPEPAERSEPIAIRPRVARKRKGVLRRRRIDARKLRAVDPAAALRAMVSAVDDLWTAGHQLDLVVALTDGGALRVAGGDREPLVVTEVEPGAPARTTVTATSNQVVPLFGRLDLTDEQSAPLIHGSRRDADLLVGWIDRAQRLAAEPL